MDQLKYPLSSNDKKILSDVISEFFPDQIFDVVSKNIHHYSSQYESLDGVSLVGNVPTIDDTGITLATAAVLNSTSGLTKGAVATFAQNFGKKQTWSVTTNFYTGSLTAMEAHFIVGTYVAGENYYGFKVVDGALTGICSNSVSGSESSVSLGTLSVNTSYEFRASLSPLSKVIFSVNDVEKGSTTTNVPREASAIAPVGIGNIFDWLIKTTNANAKTLIVGNFELWQSKR